MKLTGKTVLLLMLSLLPWIASAELSAQPRNVTVSGVVVDANGDAVPGVFLVGENDAHASTDLDGNFSITVSAGSEIVTSCLGFAPYRFRASAKNNMRITLVEDSMSLEESVVVGYATQKKAVITGAVTAVSDKAISTTTSNDFVSKLQGKVSGLNIKANSGTPGGYDTSINIRGFGTPLFIIDGAKRTDTEFYKLNSEDIESISVLKDASAAIYGLNAANGVVIVTTKSGNSYGRTRFQFNSNFGFSSPTDRIRMADGYEYYYLRNAASINAGDSPYISPEELEKWRTGEYVSTDWYGETFKKSSLRQEYSLSAEGGSEKVKYYFNFNYTDDNGLLRSGDINYNKWNFRSNVTAQLAPGLKGNVNVSGYIDSKTNPSADIFNIYRGTVTSLPYKPVYANNNPLYYNGVKDGQSYNPVAQSYEENVGYKREANTNAQVALNLTWVPTFFQDLELKGSVYFDTIFYTRKGLRKNWKMYSYDVVTDTYAEEDWNPLVKITNAYDKSRRLTAQLQANYRKTIAENHNLAASFIFESKAADSENNSIEKYFDFYTNDQIDYAGDKDMKTTGNEGHTRNLSFIGRLTYDYKGKYLLEAAVRHDGSYRYHPDVRWGTFPVVSAGWRISEEKWMKDIKWLSNLKLRGSYGIIGEDAGEAFQYVIGYTISGGGWWEYDPSGVVTGVSSPALVNEHLTWTKSYLADLGLDMGFFDNRLNITADVFCKDKTGMLAYRNVSIPNTFGATFPQENLNSNRTQGIEFSFSYQDRVGDFFYTISANTTFGRTKYLYIERSEDNSSWSKYTGNYTNRWNDLAWIYNCIGVFQNQEEIDNYALYDATVGNKYVLPGDYKYEDVNGDGLINDDDKRPISLANGTTPAWNYGLTLSGSWRGLDMSILFQGAAGFVTYYSGPYAEPFWMDGNIPAFYMDAWHHEDPYDSESPWVAGEYPSIRPSSKDPYRNWPSQMSYKDCSYVRLKNVELGYTFNQKWLKKAHIEKVRIFVNVNNVLTICDKHVKAYDPEKVAGLYSLGWNYPLLKTFNAGINLNF